MLRVSQFQSQTRSRPSCHFSERLQDWQEWGSISNEKPPPLPPFLLLHFVPGRGRFQSQTRSRPSCHTIDEEILATDLEVSISNEKPPQLPRRYPYSRRSLCWEFQSQTRSRPSCHARPHR